MIYQMTRLLLDAVKPYCSADSISISSNNPDGKHRSERIDVVTLVKQNNVGFEVEQRGITVFCFTTHIHFEDPDNGPEPGMPDFAERAQRFLIELFTRPIRHTTRYKGRKLYSEQYCLILPEGEHKCNETKIRPSGLSVFCPERTIVTTWQYDPDKHCFTFGEPWTPDPSAIEVIEMVGRYIEVFKKGNAYSTTVWKKEYEEYEQSHIMHYWIPANNGRISFFDTRDKAVAEAVSELQSSINLSQER